MKILVVDDDLELSSLIGYALRQAGYMVVEAGMVSPRSTSSSASRRPW